MKTYTSLDGIKIRVGENAKENDDLTMSSYPKEWWMHVDGGAGSHVVVCYEGDIVPKETKTDAAVLAIHHSKSTNIKMVRVNLVRVHQVMKRERSNHGEVYLSGNITQLSIFTNKEKTRLERLLKT
jgi:predicted ribosome quality control (RQC) complex YloA/Tae2 family protein